MISSFYILRNQDIRRLRLALEKGSWSEVKVAGRCFARNMESRLFSYLDSLVGKFIPWVVIE